LPSQAFHQIFDVYHPLAQSTMLTTIRKPFRCPQ
jgi:hypothetical protein